MTAVEKVMRTGPSLNDTRSSVHNPCTSDYSVSSLVVSRTHATGHLDCVEAGLKDNVACVEQNRFSDRNVCAHVELFYGHILHESAGMRAPRTSWALTTGNLLMISMAVTITSGESLAVVSRSRTLTEKAS